MHKLTVFTVILSVVVVVVVAELLFNNYLPDIGNTGKTDITSSHPSLVKAGGGERVKVSTKSRPLPEDTVFVDTDIETLPKWEENDYPDSVDIDIDALLAEEDEEPDIEDVSIEILSLDDESEFITRQDLDLAGFPSSELIPSSFDGSIFQTVDVSDLEQDIRKQYVANADNVFGAIYTFSVDEDTENELYRVLRERSAFGKAVEVNETNSFGDNSFYMNDSRRNNTTFLVVRVKNVFYAFAYPKNSHKYFKPLVQNL